MEQPRIFVIELDGKLTDAYRITIDTTIGDIKDYFREYLLTKGKDPLNYNVRIFLDKNTNLELDIKNPIYDTANLSSVWNRIRNGYIILTRTSIPDILSEENVTNENNIKLDKCTNQIDYITQEEWAEYEPQEVLSIRFGEGGKWFCYDRSMLSRWIDQPNNTMANWVPRDPERGMDDVGHGGIPGPKRFVKLPDGWWIEKDVLKQALDSNEEDLTLVNLGKERIGNLRGSFGIGNLHGQLPAETIWGKGRKRKTFKITVDGTLKGTIPIDSNVTIKTLKDYFKDYLSRLGKDSLDYNINIYLDTTDKLDVNNTDKYDNMSLDSVWNRITNGHIVLTRGPNYFRRLYTDAIYQIALRLDLKDLSSLCRADKRMSRICNDDNFWLMRFNQDYGIMINPDKESWREFYKNVVKYSKVRIRTNEDLIKYGKYLINLNLTHNRMITDEGLEHVPNLTDLDLSDNKNITNEGLKYVPNLISLNLWDNEKITDEGLKYVPNLTSLDLGYNKIITDEGLKYVPNLTSLNLTYNDNITDEGLKYVLNLTSLDLARNRKITDEGLKYVPNLTSLGLKLNKLITDEGLKHVPNLTSLDLYGDNKITDEGLKYVPNLISLNLRYNETITDEGLKYVPNLISLNLESNNKITDEGLKYAPNLTEIKRTSRQDLFI